MIGLMSLAHHLVKIFLVWLAVIVIAQLIKWGVTNNIDTLRESGAGDDEIRGRKETLNKTVSVVSISATVLAAAFAVVFVLFLYNPAERGYDEMNKIKAATVDENFVSQTKEEIRSSNREAVERKSREKEQEAEEDNTKAMNEALELFQGVEDRVDAKSP